MVSAQPENSKRRADQYDDPTHNYQSYWQGRSYEHLAETMAIAKLLKRKHFKHALDIGGGYGRLSVELLKYADTVTLAEPSQQQLDIASQFLSDKNIEKLKMQADDLKFKDGSIDLVTMIRVLHHLPDPTPEFSEISRVLSYEGYAIIEMANYAHFLNRLKYWQKRQSLPSQPVDIRSPENRRVSEIPFVNHNPATVIKQLEDVGLEIEATLSVSNLRSPKLKKILPKNIMLNLEKPLQQPLSRVYFGPSIFFLVRKAKHTS